MLGVRARDNLSRQHMEFFEGVWGWAREAMLGKILCWQRDIRASFMCIEARCSFFCCAFFCYECSSHTSGDACCCGHSDAYPLTYIYRACKSCYLLNMVICFSCTSDSMHQCPSKSDARHKTCHHVWAGGGGSSPPGNAAMLTSRSRSKQIPILWPVHV